jgi:hypothetical protein
LWDVALLDKKSILLSEGPKHLIHKVNRPGFLSLVAQPKASENDPGGSQGSGNFYEQQGAPEPESKQKPEPESIEVAEARAKLALVVAVDQIGMTAVVADFLEQKKNEAPVSPGLSVRYTNDTQPAKGLLLNKKAE